MFVSKLESEFRCQLFLSLSFQSMVSVLLRMFFVNYMSTMNYDADGFVLLDTVEDDAELDVIVVDTFDVLTCSTTFAGVL